MKAGSFELTTLVTFLISTCSALPYNKIEPSILADTQWATGVTYYALEDNIKGQSFFEAFDWFTADDPTHGRVDYVSMDEAVSSNLSFASENKFVMRSDNSNIVDPSARGRKSVRIGSKKEYNDGITILDADHMPAGCGTWPAFWTVTREGWPVGGEIDILEGANDKEPNLSSLHTSAGCTMHETPREMTGTPTNEECSVPEDRSSNLGCGVRYDNSPGSYGKAYNKDGGGWYAMKRGEDGIFVWFWPRNSKDVPSDVKDERQTLDTSKWGTPVVAFVPDKCDMPSHFGKHVIVINLTFCGDWATGSFNSDGCAGTCDDLVNNRPEAFNDAYWSINAVRTYTPTDQAPSNNDEELSSISSSSASHEETDSSAEKTPSESETSDSSSSAKATSTKSSKKTSDSKSSSSPSSAEPTSEEVEEAEEDAKDPDTSESTTSSKAASETESNESGSLRKREILKSQSMKLRRAESRS